MAYSGWLIKVGNYIIPSSIIRADSYSIVKNSQDLDSYRDANGYLQRTALEHTPNKAEFELIPMLTNTEFANVMQSIKANFTDAKEKKASVTLYVPEDDDYVTQDMYMSDITPSIYGTYGGMIHYNSIRFAFIGY